MGRQLVELPEHASGLDATLDLFGLAMTYPKAVEWAAAVAVEDIHCPAMQGLYRALQAVHQDGGDVTLDTVLARLYPGERRLVEDGLGGVEILTAICVKASFPGRAPGLKQVIARAAVFRRTLGALGQIEQAAMSNGDLKGAVGLLSEVLKDVDAPSPLQALARPWRYTPPEDLPPRRWLYHSYLIRGYVSCTVSPGGLGKSALELVKALSLATGRPLLGVRPTERVKVWFLNLEDPMDEIERRIAAACLHYNIRRSDLEDWLIVGSGRDADFITATTGRDGVVVNDGLAKAVISMAKREGIGAMFIDPFVSTHRLPENDNGAVDAVVKRFWGRIAEETACAVSLVHHVKKGTPGQATTVEDARGAVSLIGAVRSALVLNAMTEDEAGRAGIDNRAPYFRVNNGKQNLAPAHHGSDWYRFVSVDLGNGDNVGVITRWEWPSEMKVDLSDVAKVHSAMASLRPEEGRKDIRSPHWLGHTVAKVLGLDVQKSKKRIALMLETWEKQGHLTVEVRKDYSRQDREYFLPAATVAEVDCSRPEQV